MLMPLTLKNKRVTIIGARRSGVALANLICSLEGIPRISDSGPKEASLKDLEKLESPHLVAQEWNGHTRKFVEESDLVVLSPGVPITAAPVVWAKALGIPVWGEIELAWRFCDKPVIAVTGSNGKTTVVNLITQVLKASGKNVCLCGNVGTPFSSQVLNLESIDYVVLEISSFQLESIETFKPYIAVFLNFSQNHLDRHKDLQEYFEAKSRIFMNQTSQDFAVVNASIEEFKTIEKNVRSKVVFFNEFLADSPRVQRNPNHLAVEAVAQILGISSSICQQEFAAFKGVEHRLEFVRTIKGIHFINDSKATTAQAGRWALESFSSPVVMICGGRDKNIDFTLLRDVVKQKVKKMIVIGEARSKLYQAFGDVVPVQEANDLSSAVFLAQKNAIDGESVLLSPMCTSFDMFANYEERGKVFKEIVRNLYE